MEEIFELCELCGEPLDADNCYGTEDFPLCRYHHEKFTETLDFILMPREKLCRMYVIEKKQKTNEAVYIAINEFIKKFGYPPVKLIARSADIVDLTRIKRGVDIEIDEHVTPLHFKLFEIITSRTPVRFNGKRRAIK